MELTDSVIGDTEAAAFEIIGLRDQVKTTNEMSNMLWKELAGFRAALETTEAVRLQETRRAIKTEDELRVARKIIEKSIEAEETGPAAEPHNARALGYKEGYDAYPKAMQDLRELLRYAFENLPYPDTLTGNSEYDKARMALGIELDKCTPVKQLKKEQHYD